MNFSDTLLQRRLEESFGHQKVGITASVWDNECFSSSINGMTPDDEVEIGCLAKSLTATLIAIAQSEHKLDLSHKVLTYLSGSATSAESRCWLGDLSIGQLLNHTHGYDPSIVTTLPRDTEGRIDTPLLLSQLRSAAPLAKPGVLYNYSNIGPWLAAAILERVYDKNYAQILITSLLHPLGVQTPHDLSDQIICPSIENGLQLSARELVKFSQIHLGVDPLRESAFGSVSELRSRFRFSLGNAGNNLRASYPGGFDYGGSFGHAGSGENSSCAIRFMPDKKLSIVVTAQNPRLANLALPNLFSELLPDVADQKMIELVAAECWREVDTCIYEGVFENAINRIEISTSETGSLKGTFYKRADGRFVKGAVCEFKAAKGELFLPESPPYFDCLYMRFNNLEKGKGYQFIYTDLGVVSRI